MNKQQAAEFLGVSVRALERYVQQGKISVTYEKGKTRPTANFDPTELELLKEELNQPTVKPAIDARQISPDIESRQIATELQPEEVNIVHHTGDAGEIGEIATIDKLAGIIEGLLGEKLPKVAVGEKVLLTIGDVQLLTGLSREFIRDAITGEQLPAKVIGKSWRIKRSDLHDFIHNLF
jgi:excisionase family DNA binding protein